MIVIPAIDIKEGRCVRLLQGKKEAVTVYSDDPVSMARHWAGLGAELLHVVDLDGAFTGEQKNFEVIKRIREAVSVPVQVGGGIRDIQGIERLVSIGVERVIIGTAAAVMPGFIREASERFPGKILAGVDARDGKVAIRGWEEVTEWSATEFAKRMEADGALAIIYTDISRDGMLSGPNIEAMATMVKTVNIPVIASGGVASIEDIKGLLNIEGLWGVITGKALYSGVLDLKEAIALTKI